MFSLFSSTSVTGLYFFIVFNITFITCDRSSTSILINTESVFKFRLSNF